MHIACGCSSASAAVEGTAERGPQKRKGPAAAARNISSTVVGWPGPSIWARGMPVSFKCLPPPFHGKLSVKHAKKFANKCKGRSWEKLKQNLANEHSIGLQGKPLGHAPPRQESGPDS